MDWLRFGTRKKWAARLGWLPPPGHRPQAAEVKGKHLLDRGARDLRGGRRGYRWWWPVPTLIKEGGQGGGGIVQENVGAMLSVPEAAELDDGVDHFLIKGLLKLVGFQLEEKAHFLALDGGMLENGLGEGAEAWNGLGNFMALHDGVAPSEP